jgi:hypothetical protein
VDIVLNSNTFLVKLTLEYDDAELSAQQFEEFMKSGQLKEEVLNQDIHRGWYNYHSLNGKGEYRVREKGNLIKPKSKVILNELKKKEGYRYLRTMLTVESNQHNFWSPYGKQVDQGKAEALVYNFLAEITSGFEFRIFTLNTDFIYSQVEKHKNKDCMAYFEGDFGSDSATLIKVESDTAFLLLTNGRD